MEIERSGRERLAQWIQRSKFNQLEAARLIGIDPTHLSQFLTGKRRPGLDNAVKIEVATGITVEAWLASSSDDSDTDDPKATVTRRLAKA